MSLGYVKGYLKSVGGVLLFCLHELFLELRLNVKRYRRASSTALIRTDRISATVTMNQKFR